MSRNNWPEPIATASGETAAAILRQLWSEAERVQAAIGDPARLRDLIGSNRQTPGPRFVHIVGTAPTDFKLPHSWHYTMIPRLSAPDLLLFYRKGSSFPDSALLFTGGIANLSWVTYYRRPIVVHHLQQRFTRLAATAPESAAFNPGSIREQPIEHVSLTSNTEDEQLTGPEAVQPEELYRRILASHFADTHPTADDGPGALTLAAHQARAYERACNILNRYNGVIVADAVGLGKTYIGLRLIQSALEEDGRAIVIVPAALRDQWKRELAYLDLDSSQENSSAAQAGAADNLDLWVREHGAVTLLSQESLGRHGFDAAAHRGARLVLIDEAHNFRNPATRRYRALSDLVRHSQVALLTATPINNTVLDLQHLIDLFAAPGAFRHLGVGDYRIAFRHAAEDDTDLRKVISACVLRRTRQFLRQHYSRVNVRAPASNDYSELRFPDRRSPVAVTYDIADTYGNLFAGLEDWMEALQFPTIDLDRDDDENTDLHACPGELLKIILLKRLESSIEAFRSTVVQQLAWCSTAVRAIDAGRLLTRPDYRASFRGSADDPGSQLAFFELMLPTPSIDPHRLHDFRQRLQTDLAILSRIHSALLAVGPQGDRKLERLAELLDGPLVEHKVLIFTEFKDTARYIYHRLSNRSFVAEIDSEQARLGLQRARRSDVIQRFAPRSNNLPAPPTRERVDILIATDVLSEGLNLQDASVVVSYDLPWNPVRLMQRIGRIDRLGAAHDIVHLYHFLPARHLDRLLGLLTRLQGKIAKIEGVLGLDHPVLAPPGRHDRTADRIRVLAQEKDGLDRIEGEIEGPLDPEEQAYIDCVDLISADGDISPQRIGFSAVIDTETASASAVAYWRLEYSGHGRGLWMCCDLDTGYVTEDQSRVISLLRTARTKRSRDASPDTVAAARRAFAQYAHRVQAQLEAARIAGDALSPNLPQSRIAAWLRRGFNSRSHRLSRDERAAADQLLERLSRRFTVAGERSLLELARELPGEPDARSLAALEERLRHIELEDDGAISLREVGTLLLLSRGL